MTRSGIRDNVARLKDGGRSLEEASPLRPPPRRRSGFVALAGTPKGVVALLNREIVTAIGLPDIQERIVALGYDPVASTPEKLGAQIKTSIVAWAKVIRAANIRVQRGRSRLRFAHLH